MMLEERARRAAAGIHRSVELMPTRSTAATPEMFESFIRFEERRRRNERVAAIVVALILAAAFGAAIGLLHGPRHQQPADSVLPEWSNGSIDITPVGSRVFLGEFGAETVSLSLSDLPSHAEVTVSFDLLVIQSWDGNFRKYGPDVFDLSVVEGPTLLHTTFASPDTDLLQAYPDPFPGGRFAGGTGASMVDALGYPFWGDSVYHLTFTFPHSSSTVRFDFSASLTEDVRDESWGVDDVEVSVDGTPVYSLHEPGVGSGP
jgi:hypothetical protein